MAKKQAKIDGYDIQADQLAVFVDGAQEATVCDDMIELEAATLSFLDWDNLVAGVNEARKRVMEGREE